MPNVHLVFFDAGGGHRSAAVALRTALQRQKPYWTVELVDVQELLTPLDVVHRTTGINIPEAYNGLLKRGLTIGSTYLLRVTQAFIRRQHDAGVRLLEEHWSQTRPDLVVSLVPNLNRALGESVARSRPNAPFVTILTDLADFPPHFWIERQSQYFICGTDEAVRQAQMMGHPADRVFRASGMIMNPAFYEQAPCNRTVEREDLGLRAGRPTGIVLFGGQGSGDIQTIADRINRSSLDVQLILVCGHNQALADQLRRRSWRVPTWVEGFTRRVPFYMQLSDFFIGKPGPGSISEALYMHLPVIVSRNAWTLPQERFNAEWVATHRVGFSVRSFKSIAAVVEELLAPATYAELRGNIERVNNRAVFEIPDLLEEILRRGRCSNAPFAQIA